MLVAFKIYLFLIHLKIASGLPGSACCAHPAAPYLIRKVDERMSSVGKYECSTHKGAPNNLSDTELFDLALTNITAPNLFDCLYPFLVKHNVSVDTLVELNVEGSLIHRTTAPGGVQPKVVGQILKSPVSVVKLTHLGLTKVDPVLFKAFSAIDELSLSSNNITELTVTTFQSQSLNTLEVLDVSSNRITHVDPCSFDNLLNLLKLTLNDNAITSVSAGTFSKLSMLTELNLSRNRLSVLHSPMFDGLSSLITLNIRENQIQNLDLEYPYDCTAISNSCNSNCTQPTQLNSLETLDLSSNLITEISDFFQSLCSLRTLDLSQNHISSSEITVGPTLCTEQVQDNYSALMFNLSHNKLQELLPGMFVAMPAISTLDLSNNRLSNVHAGAFTGSQSLKELLLNHNDLEQFATDDLSQLDSLDLSENRFSKVSLAWVKSLADKYGYIYLGGNQLQCDEAMAQLFQLVTCNVIPEEKQYSSKALEQLEALDETLSLTRNDVILPAPGLCIRRVSKCSKFGANMNLCLLQSYMKWIKNGTLPDNKNVLVRILTQIESLYHYARNAVNRNQSTDLGSVKKYVVDALNEVSSQIELNGDWLLGYLSSDIVMGAFDVIPKMNGAINLPETPQQRIVFTVLDDGAATFIGDNTSPRNFLPSDADLIVTACGANVTSKRPMEIELPASIYSSGGKQRLTFAMYKDDFLFRSENQAVLSGIISANVKGRNVVDAPKDILVSATFNGTTVAKENISCAFWMPANRSWSTQGCMLVNYTETGTGFGLMKATCACSHLTNFGIILDYNPTSSSSEELEETVITTITYIGVIASIVGLSITIVYRLFVQELRRGVPQLILLNLCSCLLIVYIFFLPAETNALLKNPGACFVVAMVLHFFLLSVWGWNVVEAVSMYLLLVRVYNVSMTRFLTKAAVACYGGSLILLLTGLCVSYANSPDQPLSRSYTNGDVACIADAPTSHFLVILPITLAFFANLVLFIFIIRGLNSPTKAVAARKETRKLKNRLRQAVCVTVLLGITWLFGFLKVAVQMTVSNGRPTEAQKQAIFIFDILFTIFNSVQGFVIFLMFCLLRIIQDSRCTKTWERIRTDSSISSPRWMSGTDSGRKSTSL